MGEWMREFSGRSDGPRREVDLLDRAHRALAVLAAENPDRPADRDGRRVSHRGPETGKGTETSAVLALEDLSG